MGDVRTLPTWHRQERWDCSLDRARKCVRDNPELRRLGTILGATRLYTAEEASMILTACEDYAARGVATRGELTPA